MNKNSNSYLFLTEYFPENKDDITGGVEARTYNIAKELVKLNKTVVVLCSWQKEKQKEYILDGIRVVRVGIHHPYTNEGAIISRLIFALTLLFFAISYIKKLKPDIIFGENFISYLPAFFAGILSGRKENIYITYHETWLGEWITNKGLITGILGTVWEKAVLTLNREKIVSVSKFTAKRLIKNGISEKKITIIPNGISQEDFVDLDKFDYPFPSICIINRLTPHKRVDDIIKAIHILRKKYENIRCNIIGSGPEYENLKNLSEELGLSNNIFFHEYIKNRKQVLSILASSHIFCSASILEGFGIVVLEAAGCGIPYVVTDIEPFVEVTRNGKGGIIFKACNVESLSSAVDCLLSDSQLYEIKKQELKSLAKEYYWSEIIKNFP